MDEKFDEAFLPFLHADARPAWRALLGRRDGSIEVRVLPTCDDVLSSLAAAAGAGRSPLAAEAPDGRQIRLLAARLERGVGPLKGRSVLHPTMPLVLIERA